MTITAMDWHSSALYARESHFARQQPVAAYEDVLSVAEVMESWTVLCDVWATSFVGWLAAVEWTPGDD